MARRLRTAATMLALMTLLVAAAYYGWLGVTQGWTGDDTADQTAADAPEETCTTPPPRTVQSRQVRVSVYNAGAPAGQATEVMQALERQGFVRRELTDAPDRISVDGIVLWPGDTDRGSLRLVRRQFREVRVAPKRKPLGPGINVLVGEDFRSLAPDAPRSIEVPRPEECGPAG